MIDTTPNRATVTLSAPYAMVCGWCFHPAAVTVHVPSEGQDMYACRPHFRAYFPHLHNAQHVSALCNDVEHGCGHTIAVNPEGFGIACVEYADAEGIVWRERHDIERYEQN